MSVLRDKLVAEHIENNYPNSKMVNYSDPESDLVFYDVNQLQEIDEDWFPLCCYKEKGKTIYGGRKKVVHTYTEGETGAGKTTRFVMQSIRALSSMKNKPSFVIVDIHGEIIENLYEHLKNNGYSIKILNCDNPKRSDTYNPFFELAEDCLRNKAISIDAMNRIRRISEIIQPIESSNDPIWDRGARSYTNGCILDKFEDLVNDDLPKECLTLYNIIQNHYWLREHFSDGYGSGDLFKIPHYKKKGSKALSIQKMLAVTNNAEKTRASYFGVVENHYDTFGQPSMYSLSSSNTIGIPEFIDKPTAIVIQSGCTKIGDDLISLLVNDIYTYVVKKGKENEDKRLPRNIHCFLDEFANCNIADGPEYVKMLTTSRKFGMYWHMILQCDAQLDRKFDPHIGRIIRANCTEIFMGSHDYETEVRFAKSCGQKTIESLASVVSQNNPYLEVVDLMTAERLNLMEEGYAYIKSNRHPLLKTYIEAFYNCDDFSHKVDINEIYPTNNFDYTKTLFFPDDDKLREKQRKTIPPNNNRHPTRLGSAHNPFDMETGTEPSKMDVFASSFEKADINNLLYRELKSHLATYKKEKVNDTISKLTIVPDLLKDVINEIFSTEETGSSQVCELPRNPNILKFEIIEEYIKNNDFKTKIEWEQKIQEEYNCLKDNKIFPELIMKSFTNALNEIKDELTLSNIKEIKRIISGNDT